MEHSVVVTSVVDTEPGHNPRCDVYRLGGSCGQFAKYRVSGPFDFLDACHLHIERILDAQIANEALARP